MIYLQDKSVNNKTAKKNNILYDLLITTNVKILGVASSLRDNSSSTFILKVSLELAKKHGAETRLLDLKEQKMPPYDPNVDQSNDEVKEIEKTVNWADGFILATPDYHGSMSGTMKNFLDYFWTEFAGKTFGYICASHEKGLTVMDQMRTAIRQCYGWSLPYGISVNSHDDITDGLITNPRLKSRMEMQVRDLVIYGKLIQEQFQNDLHNDSADTFAARFRK